MLITPAPENLSGGVAIRVRGIVQGVGFRPTVWRLATACGLTGRVRNDGAGVLIEAQGSVAAIERFVARLAAEAPPLARIDAIEQAPLSTPPGLDVFEVAESRIGQMQTAITPDAALCDECRAEILSPFERRYRYPFTNCTHCGPRFSIVHSAPYDRPRTTMAPFAMCDACAGEYRAPSDRRFHAQPIACHACGPRARLIRFDGAAVSFEQHSMLDDVDAARVTQHGPRLETDERFPQRVNVEFLQVLDRGHLKMRVWERGVGETLSCGTGVCAASAVAHRRGLVDDRVTVTVPGGEHSVELGDTVRLAQKRAYELLEPIRFDGMQYRSDIGHRAIRVRADLGQVDHAFAGGQVADHRGRDASAGPGQIGAQCPLVALRVVELQPALTPASEASDQSEAPVGQGHRRMGCAGEGTLGAQDPVGARCR